MSFLFVCCSSRLLIFSESTLTKWRNMNLDPGQGIGRFILMGNFRMPISECRIWEDGTSKGVVEYGSAGIRTRENVSTSDVLILVALPWSVLPWSSRVSWDRSRSYRGLFLRRRAIGPGFQEVADGVCETTVVESEDGNVGSVLFPPAWEEKAAAF